MNRQKIKFGFILILLMSNILGANSKLVGSIEGDLQVQSGMVSYTLPIKTPKADKGYSPSLSVNYTQGGGNGLLGLGFTLSGTSTIARCTTTQQIDDMKGGIAFDENDKYCLDGQRLIEVDTDEYRLYTSKSVKIKRYGDTSNPSYWKVWSGDGYISEYGNSNGSQEQSPKGILSWKLSSTSDRFDNKAKFTYLEDEHYISNIDYQQYSIKFNYETREDSIIAYSFGQEIKHKKRLKNIQIFSHNKLFYTYKMAYQTIDKNKSSTRFSKLKEITYCDNDNKCLNPVSFSYDEGDTTEPYVQESTELSVDELLNYVTADMNRDGFNDICYYDGSLNCAMNRGDGTFDYAKKWTDSLDTEHYNDNPNADEQEKRHAIASTLTLLDLNRDEYMDYCVVTPEGIFCGLNNKNESFIENKLYTEKFTVEDAFRFIDINQDKQIDICAFTDTGFLCSLNNNTDFEEPINIDSHSTELMIKQEFKSINYLGYYLQQGDTECPQNQNFGYGADYCTEETNDIKVPQPQLIDINNDGFLDLCGIKKQTHDLYCAEGMGLTSEKLPIFGTLKPWATALPMGDSSSTFFNDSNNKKRVAQEKISQRLNRTIRFSDLNADGLLDICYRNEQRYECRMNNGASFNAVKTWLTLDEKDWPLSVETSKSEMDLQWIINNQESSIELADKDGDGVVDFSAVVNNQLQFASNDGTKFRSLKSIVDIIPDTTTIENRKKGYTRPAKRWFGLKTEFHTVLGTLAYGPVKQITDLDGKRNIEVCYRDAVGLSCVAITNEPLALLKSVTSSLDLTTTINYGKLQTDDFYTSQDDAIVPINDYAPNSFLVKSLKTDNGIGGVNKLEYHYEGYKTHKDRGGLGFRKITISNPLKKSRTETIYNRSDSILNGKVESVKVYTDDMLISTTSNDYKIVEEDSPKSKRVRHIGSMSVTYDLDGRKLMTKTTKNIKFNLYDQVEHSKETITDSTGLSKTVETISQIKNDNANWLLGKPENIKVIHKTDDDTKTKESSFVYGSNGELLEETLEPNSDDALTTEYKINSDQTKRTIIVKDKYGNERKSYTTYDEYGRIIETKNALGHKVTTQYDAFCSLPERITGVNGLVTEYKYDGLCRTIKETQPDGNVIETFYQWSTGVNMGIDFQEVGIPSDDSSIYMITSRSSVGRWSRTFYDALDRKIREVSQTKRYKNHKAQEKTLVKIFTDYVYNNKGEMIAYSIPYFDGDTIRGGLSQWIRIEYDILGRAVRQINPSPRSDMVTTMDYDGFEVVTNSPDGHMKRTTSNALKQTVRIEENDGSEVVFKYDALGNLYETITNGTVSSTVEYDEFSRKIKMNDRTLGEWSYDYNSFGELLKQTDAKGNISEIAYDKLGRIKSKTQDGQKTTFTYDTAKNGKGKLASSTNDLVQKNYHYDKLGRVTTSTQKIDNQSFKTTYTYNEANQVSQVTYPSGMRMNYDYDINGFLESVGIPQQDIWTEELIDLEENLTRIKNKIEELEKEADSASTQEEEYRKKAEYYYKLEKEYDKKEKSYGNTISELKKTRKSIEKRYNEYAENAKAYREQANNFTRDFKNITFTYVKTVGDYNYYRYQKCTKKNAKGHCKKYKNYDFTVVGEVSNETFTMDWKGQSVELSTPYKTLNLAEAYTKWAKYYEDESKKFEAQRKKDLDQNKKELEKYTNLQNTYKDKEAKAKKSAKYYANRAAQETEEYENILDELESQKNHYKVMEDTIEQMQLDESIYTVWKATNRDAQNRLQGEWYGNGYMTTRYYNVDNTIDQIKTGIGDYLIRDIRYTYDERNNITSKIDNIKKTKEYYDYDEMDRIIGWQYNRQANKSAKITAKSYNRSYSYDIDGNMVYKSSMGRMSYNQKNQLVSTEGDSSFRYDANGNMLEGNGKRYRYNAFNKVDRLLYANGFQNFAYDESEGLIKKVINNHTTIYYVGQNYEYELQKNGDGYNQIMRHTVMVEGKPVAVHTRMIEVDKKRADKTAYIHRDLLGSVDTVTNNEQKIVYRNEFTPYGENISNLEGTRERFKKEDHRGFTGHRQISEADIINMNARLYDPEIGRFTSADTIIPDPHNTQAYNRYMYVYGNPVRYTDPDGHNPFVIAVAIALITIGSTTDDPTIAKVMMTVGSVMLGGALGPNGAGLSAIEAGAATGFTTSFISSGGDIGETIQATAISAMSAELAFQVGHGVGADGKALFESGSFSQYMAHGASQGIVSMMRGQKFEHGFVSGLVGKIGGGVAESYFPGVGMGNMLGKASVIGLFGGIASEAVGGDFYEGAVRAAFVYLYNDLLEYMPKPDNRAEKEYVVLRVLNTVSRTLAGEPLPKQGNAAEEKYLPLKFFNEISRRVLSTPQYVEPELKFPKYYYRGMGVDMVNRFTGDIPQAIYGGLNGYRYVRDYSPVYARYTLIFALTTTEIAATRGLSLEAGIVYDFTSGMLFDTQPISMAGLFGQSVANSQ